MTKFITKNHKKIPIKNSFTTSSVSLKLLSDEKLQQGIDDRNKLKLNKVLVQALISEKVRRSGKDTCGVCGTEFEDKGSCKVCDAKDAKRATNWSTMNDEQRQRFLRRHGLENDYSVGQVSKMSYNKLGNHWQGVLKKDGFGK